MEETRSFLPHARLSELIDALRGRGYRVVGPVPRDGVVVYGEIQNERDQRFVDRLDHLDAAREDRRSRIGHCEARGQRVERGARHGERAARG